MRATHHYAWPPCRSARRGHVCSTCIALNRKCRGDRLGQDDLYVGLLLLAIALAWIWNATGCALDVPTPSEIHICGSSAPVDLSGTHAKHTIGSCTGYRWPSDGDGGEP